MLVTASGDLYRIATIVNPNFTDEVAINPLENYKVLEDRDFFEVLEDMRDDLDMGLFVVESKTEFSNSILN